jgi:glycosyltransferase involved in cell wall biosynthesis
MRVVLIAADWNNMGSVEDQAITLARGLARFEVRSLIISSQLKGPMRDPTIPLPPRLPYHEKLPEYEIYRLPVRDVMTRKRLFLFYLRVAGILFKKIFRFRLIQGIQLHTNGGLAARMASFFGCRSVIKVVSTGFRGDLALFYGMPMSSRLNRWARQADAFVSLNDDVTQDLVRAGIPKSRIRKISEGVNTGHCRPVASEEEKTSLRARLGVAERQMVLFVGKLSEENNLDVLLLAWQKASAYLPKAQLFILGDGILRQPLEGYSQQLGLERRVKFVRGIEDTVPYYQSCHVFVYPARSVTVATTVLEAMACGAPIISTRIAGTSDIMIDSETGLLCEPGDVRALATAIVYLMNNPEDAAAMGRAARQRAVKHFSIEAYTGRYLSLYQQLIGK